MTHLEVLHIYNLKAEHKKKYTKTMYKDYINNESALVGELLIICFSSPTTRKQTYNTYNINL